MTCREARKVIANWALGLADRELAARAGDHARECAACGQLMARERVLTDILAGLSRAERTPPGLSDRIDAAIRAAARTRSTLAWLPAAAACASVVAVVAGGLWLGSMTGAFRTQASGVALTPAELLPAPRAESASEASAPAPETTTPSAATVDEPGTPGPSVARTMARTGVTYASLRAPQRRTSAAATRPTEPGARPTLTERGPGAEAYAPIEISLAMDIRADELSLDLGATAETIVPTNSEGSSDIVLAGMTSLVVAPDISSGFVMPGAPAGLEVHSQ